jgi:hypothetical protein
MGRPVTVRWHEAAKEDAAQVWLASVDRGRVQRAIDEADQLLRVDPAKKGRAFALATMTDEEVAIILERTAELSEDLRLVVIGPIRVFFLPREDDGMAIVCLVRKTREE